MEYDKQHTILKRQAESSLVCVSVKFWWCKATSRLSLVTTPRGSCIIKRALVAFLGFRELIRYILNTGAAAWQWKFHRTGLFINTVHPPRKIV